jgi:HEAT repeat protein
MKRRILFIAMFVVVLGGVAWVVFRPHGPPEPTYQGKPLSYWLRGYRGSFNAPTPRDADKALDNIGTNAIPTLLRLLQEPEDPKWKLKLIAMVQKQHLIKTDFVTAPQRNLAAALAFSYLGDKASNAVPALVEILDREITVYPSKPWLAGTALGGMGRAARPAATLLSRAATNGDPGLRDCALTFMGSIRAEPGTEVPILANALIDQNTNVRVTAAKALGNYGADAKAAVPALAEALKNPDINVRVAATNSLKKIDPKAAAQAAMK